MAERRWQKFTGRRRRSGSSEPRVALYRGATFNLNQAAYEALGSPARVVFYYIPESQEIGIRGARTGDTEAEAYPLQNPKSSPNSYYITVLKFVRDVVQLTDAETFTWEPAEVTDVDGSTGVVLPLLAATKSASSERRAAFVSPTERSLVFA